MRGLLSTHRQDVLQLSLLLPFGRSAVANRRPPRRRLLEGFEAGDRHFRSTGQALPVFRIVFLPRTFPSSSIVRIEAWVNGTQSPEAPNEQSGARQQN